MNNNFFVYKKEYNLDANNKICMVIVEDAINEYSLHVTTFEQEERKQLAKCEFEIVENLAGQSECMLSYFKVADNYLQQGIGKLSYAFLEKFLYDNKIRAINLTVAPFGTGREYTRRFWKDRGCTLIYNDEGFVTYEEGRKELTEANLCINRLTAKSKLEKSEK